MAEWWFNNSGQNMLQGIPGDESNPALLPDEKIASFFDRIPEARASYLRLRTGLPEAERERLDTLLRMADGVELDPVVISDAIQRNWNQDGVRTAGKYGGTRRGGNR